MGEYRFPTRLFDTLLDVNITQKELAAELGVKQSAVSRYLHGSSDTTTKKLYKIAELTGKSSDYLLGLDDRDMVCLDGLDAEARKQVVSMIEFLKKNGEK